MKFDKMRRAFGGILAMAMPVPFAAGVASCSSSEGVTGDASTGGSAGSTGSGGQSAGGAGSGGQSGMHAGGASGAAGNAGQTGSGGAHAGGASGAGGAGGAHGTGGERDAAVDAGFNSCGERIYVSPIFGTGCGQHECFPLEGGAFPGDASTLPGTSPTCERLCGHTATSSGVYTSCEPAVLGGAPVIKCQRPLCEGRRPAGLESNDVEHITTLRAYLCEMARLEAASVPAFRRLRRELVAHGAPRRLVRAAERAARDEVRHARMTRALARRYGGVVAPPVIRDEPVRDWEAIATENAVEGCVRETFGALLATWQARYARDPDIRAAMTRIARDETRHAALSLEVEAWSQRRLCRAARQRVAEARRVAMADLAASTDQLDAEARAALGLPTAAGARALATSLSVVLAG